jgi:hypothetical protein
MSDWKSNEKPFWDYITGSWPVFVVSMIESHFWNFQFELTSRPSLSIISSYTQKKSSVVDNWYLDVFFEKFICGRWFIYQEQTIYHLCRPISCWLSSLAVEYHLLWTIISNFAWYSSPADDIQLKQLILNWRGWYLSRADDIHPMETVFIQERRISSLMVNSWNYNQPLDMIFNHWGS